MDYTSVKDKLIQSWHYKTLTVIKRHKSLSLSICYNHLYHIDDRMVNARASWA